MNTNLQWLEVPETPISALQINIAYAGNEFINLIKTGMPGGYCITHYNTVKQLCNALQYQSLLELPDVLIMEIDEHEQCFACIEELKKDVHLQGLLMILLTGYHKPEWKARAVALKVHDFYVYPFSIIHLHERIKMLIKLRILRPKEANERFLNFKKEFIYKMPVSKRLFDIVCSAGILLFLSPLMLLVAILIRLESKGPVIYRSRRVGTGYRIFDFYKFRSMQTDADSKVAEFQKNNMYRKDANHQAIFFKVANDPRITRVGQFIRNTSIDELPQLINILQGDMSFVGNRPLPLYEAERLTSNEWSMRFLGPAGLTGLWQITKRGKRDVSEQERMELDNYYARSYSFWLDMSILVRTFPALIQKEKV